ncbi:MAG: sulfite exporter TauE/SafE family protein [Candidatus Dormibacteraeota bacterium]|nr:sulfite exporter TauE/SafE family protein [Candidatus Dormibacteraeota bacterium]MBO0743865.1 sulfite exporter TauE/SafE family protein [Candidatus Dormibacteraeota bacterium]
MGAEAALLVLAGVLAGIVGTAGGITTLVSYPALLLVGVPPLAASVANTVAVVACWPGAALSSRPELVGRWGWLARWAAVTVLGGVAGAVLLLTTPPGLFARLVPYLLLAGSVALVAQGRLSAAATARLGAATPFLLAGGLFLVSLYNGYFGAGSGVLTLVLLLVLVEPDLVRANALKNMLIGAASIISAATFAFSGSVRWLDVLPLALGLFVGSLLGPVVARRLPSWLLRWAAALMGLGFAIRLWVAPL